MYLQILNPLFLTPVASGLIFIFVGLILSKFPPKKINWLYGYRTKSSMKDQKRWDFAQKYAANELIKLGGLSMLFGMLIFLINPTIRFGTYLALGLLFLGIIILVVRVEKAIAVKFGKE